MASEGLSRVLELRAKASDLMSKGHVARAVEICGRAVDATRALGEGEDSLIVAAEELFEAACRGAYATSPTTAAGVAERERGARSGLLLRVMEVLERRRAAGTLLPGKCRAKEEAYHAARLRVENAGLTDADAALWAPTVGYTLYLQYANPVLSLLQYPQEFN